MSRGMASGPGRDAHGDGLDIPLHEVVAVATQEADALAGAGLDSALASLGRLHVGSDIESTRPGTEDRHHGQPVTNETAAVVTVVDLAGDNEIVWAQLV